MKRQSGALMTKIIMIVLLLAVFAYLGVYLLSFGDSGYATATAVKYTAQDSVSVVGYIVRDEYILTASAEYIDIMAADGEKVAKGQAVAATYSDSESLSRQKRIEELELSLGQLDTMEQSSSDSLSAGKVEQRILDDLTALSRGWANGNMERASDLSADLKSLTLIRNSLFSGSDNIAGLKEQLLDELSELKRQSSNSDTVKTDYSGVFSSHVDGYEGILKVSALDGFTSDDFRALEQTAPQEQPQAYGKLVSGSYWYFIALVDEEYASGIGKGQTLTMSFVGGYTEEIEMTVVRVDPPDGEGQCLMVLKSNRGMADTLSLRRQYVDLIDGQYTGIRIPKSALRVDDNGNSGVYCLSGQQARFKTVEILYTLDDYFIVGEDAENAHALHVGDEVITKGKNMYDGKVVTEN